MNRWWMTSMIMALGLLAAGCMDRHRLAQPGAVAPDPKSAIVGITTRDGVEVKFDGPAAVQGDKLVAKVKHKPYETALANVQRYWVETRSLNVAKTVGLAAGVTVAVAVVVAAVVLSKAGGVKAPNVGIGRIGCCLYVYSWDGERYNFDTEAYTGAIARGLERDDFSLLQKVHEQDGEYRLLISNDADETQYTDLLELWVVDHESGVTPRSGSDGSLYSVAAPLTDLRTSFSSKSLA